jgi:bacilysin biosynthesis protein BacA
VYEDLERDMVHRLDLLRECVSGLSKVRLVTLGPEGTSSEMSARYFLKQLEGIEQTLTLAPTYEQAADLVVGAEADLLLVANAYKNIDRLYMTPELYFICAYFFQTPDYGIGALHGTVIDPTRRYTISSHHAPLSLIPWFLEATPIDYEIVDASSTAAAANAVRKGDVELCVTNAVALKHHGLEFVTRTRPIRMLWSVFQRKRGVAPSLFPRAPSILPKADRIR